jgi:HKD family nuclease
MVPTMDFHGQPFREEDAAGELLRRALADDSITSLSVAVAWARFGGLARIEDALEQLRRRGGTARAILGIDEGGATRPGLRKAVDIFDEVFVLHDPSGRTFHPKVYLAEGATKALLFVGSSNATAGGLFFNYEASVEGEFRLPEDNAEPALRKARRYFELLQEDSDICVELTDELIEELADDPRYPIAETERRRRRRGVIQPPEGAQEDELDTVAIPEAADELSAPIFGTSRHAKPGVPRMQVQARRELSDLEAEADQPIEEELPPAEPAPAEVLAPARTLVASWSKTLGHADAQQPARAGTNPTGNLRLAKAGHDVDHLTWFRRDLFGPATWTPSQDSHGNPIEEATVSMGVTLGGVELGATDLRVTHGEHRVARQGNVPTWLHWGPRVGQILRDTDYTGHTVTIERLDDDSYRLRIEP